VVHQNLDPLHVHERGVAVDAGVVGRHDVAQFFVKAGLWFGEPDGVVVARNQQNLHVAGHLLQVLTELLVLVVDVDDRQLLVLVRVDADPLDHVAGDEEILDVFGLVGVEPLCESVPRVLEELVGADVDIRDERGLHVAVCGVRAVGPGHLGEVDGVDEHDGAVVAQPPFDGDDLIEEEFVDEVSNRTVLHDETREDAVGVFQFDEPVAARGRPDVVDHPDEPGLATPL